MKLQRPVAMSLPFRAARYARSLALPLRRFFLALATVALFATAGGAYAAGPGPEAVAPHFAAGHILVEPQPESANADFQQALVAHGGRSLGRLRGT